ncbi:hypothetical protein N657DRAFT_601967 [Parathielavia appendiculata]|uniref:Uncharacterized protein n=1 Tax=Parathielavia appendiculata TaxID=2587402 RepID=A0AAN6TVV6_9PEZI|nr:hypothetical protein N657DRAFT_601967 [Parathielavia appendiculata]
MTAVTRCLAVAGWLVAGAAAIAYERFVAVETGVILSPREYHVSPAQPLGKRQDGCNPESHPCNEIGPAGASICCPNNQYCIINPMTTTLGACCHIGATCGAPCPEFQFQCNSTVTLTTGTLTATTTSPACCNRTCTQTSMFQCPSSLGGGCCAYGARCATDGHCLAAAASTPATTTGSLELSLAPPPPGCSTGQISCAATLGGGCCAATQSCTLVSGRAHCAATPPPTTTEKFSVVDADSAAGGLSPGATAGVAVGVVVGCGLVIGAVTWWCLRRRRRRMSEAEGSSSATRPRPMGLVGRVVGGSGGREMSDENSDVMSGSGRLAGLVQDYSGPAPGIGPYSETHSTSAVTTPGLDRGGVPLQPNEPGDIAVPVEIDSRLRDTRRLPPDGLATPHDEDAQERYELYGSDVGQISPTLPSPFPGRMPSPDGRPR